MDHFQRYLPATRDLRRLDAVANSAHLPDELDSLHHLAKFWAVKRTNEKNSTWIFHDIS